jgi:hypothetical protein
MRSGTVLARGGVKAGVIFFVCESEKQLTIPLDSVRNPKIPFQHAFQGRKGGESRENTVLAILW